MKQANERGAQEVTSAHMEASTMDANPAYTNPVEALISVYEELYTTFDPDGQIAVHVEFEVDAERYVKALKRELGLERASCERWREDCHELREENTRLIAERDAMREARDAMREALESVVEVYEGVDALLLTANPVDKREHVTLIGELARKARAALGGER